MNARYATQALKANLQAAYKSAGSVGDGAGAAEDDQLDAKMVWIYAVGTVLPPCAGQAAAWAGAARIQVREQPLVGYDPALYVTRICIPSFQLSTPEIEIHTFLSLTHTPSVRLWVLADTLLYFWGVVLDLWMLAGGIHGGLSFKSWMCASGRQQKQVERI